jgi:sugar phosphate isomerase/epimerase
MPDPGQTIAGFGFCTSGAKPDLSDLDDQLARLEAAGATHAELSLFELDLIAGGRVLPERRRRLERICAGRRLGYTVHGALGMNFMDEDRLELHKAVCSAMLELTGAVGAGVLVHHAGIAPAQPWAGLEPLYAIELDALREMGDVAARYGVRIAVENLFPEDDATFTADPVLLAWQIAQVDHPNVCGTLDFSHAYLASRRLGLDYLDALKAFAPCVNHLHVHDSFGRLDAVARFHTLAEQIAYGVGDVHLPMGWGDIAWDEILPQLPFRPGTVMIVELMQRHWSDLDACAATARRFAEIVNRSQAAL